MAKVREIVVRRQYKEQIWYEAIDLQEYQQMGKTHETRQERTGSSASVIGSNNPEVHGR